MAYFVEKSVTVDCSIESLALTITTLSTPHSYYKELSCIYLIIYILLEYQHKSLERTLNHDTRIFYRTHAGSGAVWQAGGAEVKSNSSQLRGMDGKYEELATCPHCGKKVHTEENDVNLDRWSFYDRGEFYHSDCLDEMGVPEDERG